MMNKSTKVWTVPSGVVGCHNIGTSTSCVSPPPPDPTLTSENLMTVLEEVHDWHMLGFRLDIPDSKLREIREHYPPDNQCKVSMVTHWLHTHPAPSWKRVAGALQDMGKDSLAEMVATKYIRGNLSDISLRCTYR